MENGITALGLFRDAAFVWRDDLRAALALQRADPLPAAASEPVTIKDDDDTETIVQCEWRTTRVHTLVESRAALPSIEALAAAAKAQPVDGYIAGKVDSVRDALIALVNACCESAWDGAHWPDVADVELNHAILALDSCDKYIRGLIVAEAVPMTEPMTIRQIASLLGYHRNATSRMLKDGSVPNEKVGSRYRIPARLLEDN